MQIVPGRGGARSSRSIGRLPRSSAGVSRSRPSRHSMKPRHSAPRASRLTSIKWPCSPRRLPAPSLLRLLKEIERQSGRRGGRPWGARTLDLDIIDYKGLIMGRSKARKGVPRERVRPLVLPHPQLENRPFVLKPLLDVAPNWRHPVTKTSAKELWRRVEEARAGKRAEAGLLKSPANPVLCLARPARTA